MSKPRAFKHFQTLDFVNSNTEVKNTTPQRFAIKDGVLYGVYEASYNKKIRFLGDVEYWYKSKPISYNGVKCTYTYDELVDKFPEYVF